MAHALIFALLRIAVGLVWLGALVVLWAGFWTGPEQPTNVRGMMHFIAVMLTLMSLACAILGWLCGRLMGRGGWMPAVAVVVIGVSFIPYFFGEAPNMSSLVVAAPIIVPPVLFGYLTGWRRWAALRR